MDLTGFCKWEEEPAGRLQAPTVTVGSTRIWVPGRTHPCRVQCPTSSQTMMAPAGLGLGQLGSMKNPDPIVFVFAYPEDVTG